MIYHYKDPKGDNIFETNSSQVKSPVNSALCPTCKQQWHNSHTLSTLPSAGGNEKEMQGIVMDQQSSLVAASNCSCTKT